MRYRLKVFLLLSTGFTVLVLGWQWWRHGTHADEREAWEATTRLLDAQQGRIDSLEAVLAELDARVTKGKQDLASIQRRLAHYERRASGGRLPTPQYREYMRAIESHNALVTRHNENLTRMQRIYADYSALIERHNVTVESANDMQRRAIQEGYALPDWRPLPEGP